MQQPQLRQQNEDRVSTFMPETMKAAPPQMPRPPFRQPVQPPMSMPTATSQPQQQARDNRKPPSDWLTPKVYKGSDKLE